MLACGSRSIAKTRYPRRARYCAQMRADRGFSAPAFEICNRENLQMLGGLRFGQIRGPRAREKVSKLVDLRESIEPPAAGTAFRRWPLPCQRQLAEISVGDADQPGSLSAREGAKRFVEAGGNRRARSVLSCAERTLAFSAMRSSSDAGACEAGPR